jgi:diacylglycerol kinase family enzyme
MHVVKCGHCGTRVPVSAWREPLSYAERETDDGRHKLVIIGGDGLLHECIIDEHKVRARVPGVDQPAWW